MKALKYLSHRLYTTWCVTWFVMPFVVTYPFQAILIRKQRWHPHVHGINRFWSSSALRMFLAPLQVEWRMRFDRKKQYIFTPNHSSYLDIPLMLHAIPGFINFVGKSSLTKVPLWGKVYEKLYIAVDRKSAISSAKSYIQSVRSLEQGRNLVIFPEGTIPPTAGEELLAFKDGPFRLAIEKQLPVVPVTMPYNHKFLPDLDGKLKVRWHPLKIIMHEPIETQGMTLQDLPALKEQVFNIIQEELKKHNPIDVNRYTNH
ncbi:1-acyl-sn-glycerol-3-phosphate acyltransferase [Pontibacter sp. HSC-36F09]|uniref:lysophospholipid acyltransferase family protein n=1 Tax=Pontibacter sp. HSC-36F09 TaxID=2910966 RepID=UPI00209CAA03|nr:lysophospholipid acyltransferase family protein [Pontibacter sp. HSC-36F09]MCP2042216.1 1-acyl-sn-glycerol-3-phosphate acyltransferase [Pontibacter sp. HSC-36F09]